MWNLNTEYLHNELKEVSYYQIGPDIIKLHYSELSDLTYYLKSIKHLLLEIPVPPFDFQLYCWETDSVDIQVPSNLLNWEEIDPYNGQLKGLPNGLIGVKNTNERSFIWIDKAKKTIFYILENIRFITHNELVAPFRSIFHLWYEDSPYFMCHAAGIAVNDQGILLTAKGGSGKSTSSLACIQNGLNYSGDDFLLVDSKKCIAYSLYNVAKLDIPQFEMFPELKPHIENIESTPREKGQVFLNKLFPDQMCLKFQIKALLIPVFSKGLETNLFKCSKGEAIKALVPSSIWIMRGAPSSANKMIQFIQQLDCQVLSTGTDFRLLSDKIKEVIHEN